MPASCFALALAFVFSSFAQADLGTTGDGGSATDTGKTVEDTGTTGGETGDTGDTGGSDGGGGDTGFVGGGVSVSDKAGETGGFGCEQAALVLGLPLGLLGLSRRRR